MLEDLDEILFILKWIRTESRIDEAHVQGEKMGYPDPSEAGRSEITYSRGIRLLLSKL
jgi:hypothetical protein